MSLEETFRRVLAARLPAGPGWTAWIDGAVAELAAADAGRRTVERDTIRNQQQRIEAVLTLCDRADRDYASYQFERIGDEIRELLEDAS